MDPGYWPISSNKPSHEGTFEILVEDIQPLDHENIQTIKDDNSQSKDEKELAIKHQEFETIKDELHQRESVISLHQNLSETTEKKNLRFCSYCKISQPYRTKHCRDCEKCVSLYDHHCPWIGGCVGQNNRIYFFWYVFLQCIELWIALYYVISN